jgi:hypothetical protein
MRYLHVNGAAVGETRAFMLHRTELLPVREQHKQSYGKYFGPEEDMQVTRIVKLCWSFLNVQLVMGLQYRVSIVYNGVHHLHCICVM